MDKRIVIIFGKTGTGKSTLAKLLMRDEKRIIIIDPKDEYDGIVIEDFLSFIDYIKGKDEFKIVYRHHSDLDIEYLFQSLPEIKNVLLVVEEAESYIDPRITSSPFLDLCRYGRHENIKILGIARRAAELSSNFRALCEIIISFKQTEIMDLEKLQKYGFEGLENLEQFVWNNNYPVENIHYKLITL